MLAARAKAVIALAVAVVALGCGEILQLDGANEDGGAAGEVDASAEGTAPGDASLLDAPPIPDGGQADAGAGLDGAPPIVFYTFDEGQGSVVNDKSPITPLVNLTIEESGTYQWSSAGLQMTGTRAVGAAPKLLARCTSSRAMSIEAWIRSAKKDQAGPARVVTMSSGAAAHNFMLGVGSNTQPGTSTSSYVFRYTSGTTPSLEDTSAEAQLQYVVATLEAPGQARLYVDGVERAVEVVSASSLPWMDLPLALGGEPDAGARFFDGTYAFVALYDRALGPDEVAARYLVKPR